MDKFNQTKYIQKFIKESYDRIEVKTPKGTKDKLKIALGGQSVNSFLNQKIEEKLKEGN